MLWWLSYRVNPLASAIWSTAEQTLLHIIYMYISQSLNKIIKLNKKNQPVLHQDKLRHEETIN